MPAFNALLVSGPCFIHNLPVELLERVFIEVMMAGMEIYSPYASPFVILEVCKLWNTMVMSCPALWSTYSAPVELLPFTQQILCRSGNHPLNLRFEATNLKGELGYQETYQYLLQLSHRWKVIDFRLYETMVPDFLTALSKTTDTLQSLVLYMDDTAMIPIAEIVSEHCQSLRHLELVSFSLYNQRKVISFPWSRLTSITISTSSAITISDGRYLIASCTSAKSIQLGVIKNEEGTAPGYNWDSSSISTLPALESLCLVVKQLDPANILKHFTLPNLQHLELRHFRSFICDPPSFGSFLTQSGCQLRKFVLDATGTTRNSQLVAEILLLEPLQAVKIIEFRLQGVYRKSIFDSFARMGRRPSFYAKIRPYGLGLPGVYIDQSHPVTRSLYY
ncbi:hypothetical protein FA15DRAFT_136392 [Coprinopsis marcescibilis]|uniref:F-box domain-containing protein n=1 Tax=Coprinopsis marcescibilis TaxID=230819 RepID=A0A5C3KJ54_COPMA|nr:hypothetical protein FA15DRAFT_136392 [Coprinopsis marcescibilis]